MVEYACGICRRLYSKLEDAENCEKQGLIGPNLEPGLILYNKNIKDSFKIFYRDFPSSGHEKNYEFEEFLIWKYSVCPVNNYNQSASEFIADKSFIPATKEQIERINKLIEDNFPGMRSIKSYMNFNNVKEIHNRLELKVKKAGEIA
jgi:hypothetical protein